MDFCIKKQTTEHQQVLKKNIHLNPRNGKSTACWKNMIFKRTKESRYKRLKVIE